MWTQQQLGTPEDEMQLLEGVGDLCFQVDNDEYVKKVLSGGGGEPKKERGGDKEDKRERGKDRTRSAGGRKEEVGGGHFHFGFQSRLRKV